MTIRLVFAAACAVAAFACSQKVDIAIDAQKDSPSASKTVTISATLADAITKVAFDPSFDGNGKPVGMSLTWEDGDQIRVYDAADHSNYSDFTLDAASIGQNVGLFTGSEISAASYDVEVINAAFDYASQTQAADRDTGSLKYLAGASGITDYSNITFTEFSSVLAITAGMPSGVAEVVKSVELVAGSDIFAGGNTLTITLDSAGDAGSDNILHFFATLPQGDQAIAAGTPLFVRFYAPGTEHTVYTRYLELPAGSFTNNKVNALNINATQTASHAGATSCDGTTAAKAYLIADPYQLAAVNDLATNGSTTFFKLIDDVDMTGVTHNQINTGEGYNQVVDFDGNNKTISYLNSNLFYVIKGSVYDLTLDRSSVTARGILAEFIQGDGNTVSNVTIDNGTLNSSSNYVGGLIGRINNGSGVCATISNCTVAHTNVTGAGSVGGVIGYSEVANTTITGCLFYGGTVTSSGRWCGGFIGSTGDYATTISDCHVENATVSSSADRVGGFVGQIGKNGVTVKGCTVGTSSNKVAVGSTLSGANVNLGGFVGVCYGTVTKNGDVRSEAHVTITSDNTSTSTYVNIGGFVGYLEKGTVEYSDADATMASIKGHQVAGFAATLTKGGTCTVDNCTANATVSGNNYVAGFIGQAAAANHVVTNNSSSGTVSGAATVAGFVGLAAQGTWTKNSTSCTVTASGANSGNFAGQLNGNVTVSKCFCNGSITGNGNVCGGFTGIASNGATINDCYSTCAIGGGTRKRGGIAGYVDAGTVSINRCYSTCNISNNFEMGGLVGFVSVETFTMTKCAAWNETLVAANRADNNWSSAACVGVTYLTCTLTDNYRSPNMDSLVYWGTNSGCTLNLPNSFQHPDVSTSAPLTDPDGNAVTSSTMRPYQGKCDASKTLSELASTTLGWDGSVWDFSGDLPTLR